MLPFARARLIYIYILAIYYSEKVITNRNTSYPFPEQQNFYSSKLKDFADDSLILDKNGKMLSKNVENTLGKGEIARHEQFLIFPQCFQKTCSADM